MRSPGPRLRTPSVPALVVLAVLAVLTVLLAGAARPAAAAALSAPTQKAGPATDVAIPLTLTPADGVTTLGFTLTYDPAVLTATGAFRTGFTNAFALSANLATPGVVSASLSGPALAGTGDVCWIVFRAKGAAGASSTLAWTSATLNGGAIPVTTANGKVVVGTATSTISAPDNTAGTPGTQVSVPVNIVPADGGEAFDVTVVFNQGVLGAVSVAKTALSAPLTLTYNVGTPGQVRISLFGTGPITGSGPLATILFNVVGPLGERTPLDVTRGDINEKQVSTNLDDGLFTVCGSPTLTIVPHPVFEVCTAGAHDTVRGDVALLRSSGFATATQTCLPVEASGCSFDAVRPTPGNAQWYLTRLQGCGAMGTWNDGTQTGDRDPGINASPNACP